MRDIKDLESTGLDWLAVEWKVKSERDPGCLQMSGLGDVGAFTEMEDRGGGAGVGGWSGAQFGNVAFEVHGTPK